MNSPEPLYIVKCIDDSRYDDISHTFALWSYFCYLSVMRVGYFSRTLNIFFFCIALSNTAAASGAAELEVSAVEVCRAITTACSYVGPGLCMLVGGVVKATCDRCVCETPYDTVKRVLKLKDKGEIITSADGHTRVRRDDLEAGAHGSARLCCLKGCCVWGEHRVELVYRYPNLTPLYTGVLFFAPLTLQESDLEEEVPQSLGEFKQLLAKVLHLKDGGAGMVWGQVVCSLTVTGSGEGRRFDLRLRGPFDAYQAPQAGPFKSCVRRIMPRGGRIAKCMGNVDRMLEFALSNIDSMWGLGLMAKWPAGDPMKTYFYCAGASVTFTLDVSGESVPQGRQKVRELPLSHLLYSVEQVRNLLCDQPLVQMKMYSLEDESALRAFYQDQYRKHPAFEAEDLEALLSLSREAEKWRHFNNITPSVEIGNLLATFVIPVLLGGNWGYTMFGRLKADLRRQRVFARLENIPVSPQAAYAQLDELWRKSFKGAAGNFDFEVYTTTLMALGMCYVVRANVGSNSTKRVIVKGRYLDPNLLNCTPPERGVYSFMPGVFENGQERWPVLCFKAPEVR